MRTSATERVHRALEDIRAGRMVILVDDEDRENEGDLVFAAEKCTPEAINFMAKYARGLICLTLTEEAVRRLDLAMMTNDNQSARTTAFTVSIEARTGVSTGISAADRAHTVKVATAKNAQPSDLVTPGHVFPLRARPGGVLQRTGHTEGSVDLARLAGLEPAGVICEIMNDDGTMARMPDLVGFAETHGLRILTIADLIQYRLEHEPAMEKRVEGEVVLPSGRAWKAHVFKPMHPAGHDGVMAHDDREFLALSLGEVDESPTLVRMHTGSVIGDVFGVASPGRVALHDAIARMEKEGKGVVVFITGPVDLESDLGQVLGLPKAARPVDQGTVLREYGLGAQVLRTLGLRKIRLVTNRPRRIAGVDGYGLEVVEQVVLDAAAAAAEGASVRH
jgi:3,4-dihydroxy 2-butanone 4-phosphate synthase/GTP cyclohydrolase II